MTDVTSKNVYSKPLHRHSLSPPTGVERDGFCRVTSKDQGNHSIAGVVSDEFLDFTASKGNDLRKQAGLKGGQKWCLCANRWLEAFNAAQDVGDSVVPKVFLHATNERALDVVDFKKLKKYDAGPEIESVAWPTTHPGSAVRESKEIGGKNPKA